MFWMRSSEASSCLIRFCTETLSAASVLGVTVAVAHLKALDGLGEDLVERSGCLVGSQIVARDQTLAQQIVVRAGHADREFGVGGDQRPAATDRDVGIAQRRLPDALCGTFVEGRFVRQR